MLFKPSLSILQPVELIETLTNYVVATEEAGVKEPYVAALGGLLMNDLSNLEAVINRSRSNSLTDVTREADQVRDDLIIAFRDQVQSATRRRDPEVKAAGKMVLAEIRITGLQTIGYGYVVKSGRLKSLFKRLNTTAMQEAITLIGAADVFEELRVAQTEFQSNYVLKTKEEASGTGLRVKTFRSPVVARGGVFIDVIETLEELEPDVYPALAEQLNGITTEVMATARARRTRLENDLSDDTDTDVAEGEKPVSDDADQPVAADSI